MIFVYRSQAHEDALEHVIAHKQDNHLDAVFDALSAHSESFSEVEQ